MAEFGKLGQLDDLPRELFDPPPFSFIPCRPERYRGGGILVETAYSVAIGCVLVVKRQIFGGKAFLPHFFRIFGGGRGQRDLAPRMLVSIFGLGLAQGLQVWIVSQVGQHGFDVDWRGSVIGGEFGHLAYLL